MLLDRKNIHFVGIGGIGMSALALILEEMGYNVSGSDVKPNVLTEKIASLGGRVFKGHKQSNLPKDAEILVYSSSINKDNPELVEAKRRKIKVAHRAEILGALLNSRKGIAVTGTHGKTTTTSLISVMLERCGFDPTVAIGGEVNEFKGNAKSGKGKFMVAEADESDGSFLSLRPFYSVITNIEMEHIDHYKTLEAALSAYRAFIDNTKKGGKVFYNHEDVNIKKALKGYRGRIESFGLCEDADIYATDIKRDGFRTSFNCIYGNKLLGRVGLQIPGRHNVSNALAAILVGFDLGLDFKAIASSIKAFDGAKRRFHLRADTGDVMLIEDYAHHPTEIKAVLDACGSWKHKRLIVIFQPHRYTRTLYLADDFGKCFKKADALILTDIYAASEEPIEGVSVKNIHDRIARSKNSDVRMMRKEDIADYIMRVKKAGDMILVLGAGDIYEVADEITERLSRDFKRSFNSRIEFGMSLAGHTSFRIGGPADIWAKPQDLKGLRKILLFAKDKKIPVFIIGRGTNILVRDTGFRGLVISLDSEFFKKMKIKGNDLRVGAGLGLPHLVRLCCDKALGGLESLVGIPGTVGGAVYMNAGGSTNPIYRNIGDFITFLKVMDYDGNIKRLKKKNLKFGYRRSNLRDYIILEVGLRLKKNNRNTLNTLCSKFLKMKKTKQVLDMPSAGCVFKNPENFQFTCGQMIDMLGLKGKTIGGAQISEKHANFIVNVNKATCEDVLKLVELIKGKVRENYNIPLELEIEVV